MEDFGGARPLRLLLLLALLPSLRGQGKCGQQPSGRGGGGGGNRPGRAKPRSPRRLPGRAPGAGCGIPRWAAGPALPGREAAGGGASGRPPRAGARSPCRGRGARRDPRLRSGPPGGGTAGLSPGVPRGPGRPGQALKRRCHVQLSRKAWRAPALPELPAAHRRLPLPSPGPLPPEQVSLCPGGPGNEVQPGRTRRAADLSMEECCDKGIEWANKNRICSSLPLISESRECSMTQVQCCRSQLEKQYCSDGIEFANVREECDSHIGENSTCETEYFKACCYCCLLGKAAQVQGQSCEPNPKIGHHCGIVFRACCVKGEEGIDVSISDDAPKKEQVEISKEELDQEDPYLHDGCRGGGPCSQQCRDTGSSYVCSCFVGYQLQSDGVNCEDINECITGTHSCGIGQTCVNTLGSFRCQRDTSCGTGYELTDDSRCKDIDECETGTHNCPPDFICQNTPGSFRCRPKLQCMSGFIQDALGNCIDINECLSNNMPCPAGQICINTDGSFTCQRISPNCGRGYHLNEDGTRCVDVDECSASNQPCGEGHVCINAPGNYRCECKSGYSFDVISRTCIDINECRRYPGRLCAHKCENTPGSYYCTCTMGFKLSADGRSCEDLNECESSPCSQECANVYGSYQCYCRRGFQLSDIDGISCEDIDECALPTGGHICSFRCINIPGSFQCTCPSTGYRLAPNARNCQDIDECVAESHNCSFNETCFNIQGGFRCLSLECPENYRKSGDTRCERLPCNENKECQSLPLRITYYHLSFPTNIQVPTDIFRMGPSNAVPGDKILLSIISGNQEGFFTTKKVNNHSGIVVMQRQITEPRDLLLTIQMQLSRHGTVNTFIAKLFIFVSAQL